MPDAPAPSMPPDAAATAAVLATYEFVVIGQTGGADFLAAKPFASERQARVFAQTLLEDFAMVAVYRDKRAVFLFAHLT